MYIIFSYAVKSSFAYNGNTQSTITHKCTEFHVCYQMLRRRFTPELYIALHEEMLQFILKSLIFSNRFFI